jgi:hypothetical protein
VRSSAGWWHRNLRCRWWASWTTSLGSKWSNSRMAPSSPKWSTQDLPKRFGMKDAKPANTPMGTDGHVDLNKGGKSVDQNAYRSMIGSLLYLCASRPDIMLSVCMCARFQSDPRECHLVVVKWILRYLVATPCFGIWYPKGSTFDLIGYSDTDYAGCKVHRKSTSGTC